MPTFSELISRSREHELRAFSFANCFGTPAELTLTASGSVSLFPTLRATLRASSGLAFIPARIVGSTGYVDVSKLAQLPQIAEIAHHRRWLAFPIEASLHQPLNDILSAEQAVRLLASNPKLRSLGAARIHGTLVYGFEAAFDPGSLGATHASRETVAVYLSSTGDPIRIVTTTDNDPDTAPAVARTVEELEPMAKPGLVVPPPPSQTETIPYRQAHALMLVP